MIDSKAFLEIVRQTPLVSIDLLVRDSNDRLLMGLRLNEPAAGFWFVPGGRILKDETIPDAFSRITKAELGISVAFAEARLVGAFTHRYDTNFARVEGIGTHYVVLAHEIVVDLDIDDLPTEQHGSYRWVRAGDDTGVHENSRVYFDALGITPTAPA